MLVRFLGRQFSEQLSNEVYRLPCSSVSIERDSVIGKVDRPSRKHAWCDRIPH